MEYNLDSACDCKQAVFKLCFTYSLPNWLHFLIGRQDYKNCLQPFFNWQAGLEKLPVNFCLSAGSFVLNYDVSQAVCLPACILRIGRQGCKRVKTAWALRIGWKLPAKFCLPAGIFIFNYDVSQAVCLPTCILRIGGQSQKKVKIAFAPRIVQKLSALQSIIYLPAGSIVLNYVF